MPYEPHPDLSTPPKRTVLWRYMDFAKFVQMMESRSLWFARVDQLEDPLEATHTDAEITGLRKYLQGKRAEELINMFRIAKRELYINCWRAGSEESLAMWDLYGKGSGIVAIKSSVGRLAEAISNCPQPIYISKVKYINWNAAPGLDNVLVACSRKDLSYRHESEVRAIILRASQRPHSKHELGISLPVKPERLITEVMVGPREPAWTVNLVERVVARYGLKGKVVPSDRLKPRP